MKRPKNPLGVTGLVVLGLIVIGLVDATVMEKDRWPIKGSSGSQSSQSSSQSPPQSSSTTRNDVFGILREAGFEVRNTGDSTLIEQVIPKNVAPTTVRVLMESNDRAGQIAWVETDQIEVYFLALKEALHATFSPQVTDLVDESQKKLGKPQRHLLTFFDPSISEERVVFVKTGRRLFEFHVPKGKDELIFALVEKLTQ